MLELQWILFLSVLGFCMCAMFPLIIVAIVNAIKIHIEMCKELDEKVK